MRRNTSALLTLLAAWALAADASAVRRRRMTIRQDVKQIPRNQALYKKDFLFVNPASIGPNLKEMWPRIQQIFIVR
jgi:hypothetical protein